jgi:protein phosphatase
MTKHKRLQDIAGLTDTGLRRRNNEDAIGWDAELGLALVADGIGGNNGGEVASSTAVRSIKSDLQSALRCVSAAPRPGAQRGHAAMVHELVRRANQRILSMAKRDPKLYGMGATLAVALLADDRVVIANVGDSRVYRMRERVFEQLTCDHLLGNEMIRRGSLSTAEAGQSYGRNILSRALGMAGELQLDLVQHPVQSGDVYLLCSDGLTGAISDEEIAALLADAGADLHDVAHGAVALANRRGGRDNISVVLMRIA